MLGLKVKCDAAQYEGESYQYDINGNRLNHRIGGNNQLLNDGQEEYQYDAEGNRIAKGDVKYEWDHRNRLVKVETPQETVEYTYDYQNRLVKRSAGKNTTHFIHDGWQIALILNGNGSVKERLLWGTHQDELLAQGEKFMLNDHLNTVRDVISADGKIIAHYDYNAFGKQLNASSDTLQFAYTGKLTDSATGLQWNINRWYDANAGRWISEDPIGFKGMDDNLYRYVGNSLSNFIDKYGLYKNCVIKIYIGHGATGAKTYASNVASEANGVNGDGMVGAIACNAGGKGTDINNTLNTIEGYKTPSGLPTLPHTIYTYPLNNLLWQTATSDQINGGVGQYTKPDAIGSLSQTTINSLWPNHTRFYGNDSTDKRRAYNEAAGTVFKAFVQSVYINGLDLATHEICCGKSTIVFEFYSGSVMTRDNFVRGVWGKNAATWTTGSSNVNYEHNFSSNKIEIGIKIDPSLPRSSYHTLSVPLMPHPQHWNWF